MGSGGCQIRKGEKLNQFWSIRSIEVEYPIKVVEVGKSFSDRWHLYYSVAVQ